MKLTIKLGLAAIASSLSLAVCAQSVGVATDAVAAPSAPSQAAQTVAPVVMPGKLQNTVKEVTFTLSDEAKAMLVENEGFDFEKFKSAVTDSLRKEKQIDASSQQRIDVVITKLRMRHPSTVAFGGIFAGKDRVEGHAKLKTLAGVQLMEKSGVEATFGTTMTFRYGYDSRLNTMAEEFADELASELLDN